MATEIRRVRVTGGFLAGVDINLTPGLNVIIGPRGSGKTVLLELIRHALNTPIGPTQSDEARRAYVRAVLQAGQVILDLSIDGNYEIVMVDADGAGRDSSMRPVAIALGQNELEQIASDAASRLELIDIRASVERVGVSSDRDISLFTERLHALRDQISDGMEQLKARTHLIQDLSLLRARERELTPINGHVSEVRSRLSAAEDELNEQTRLARRAEHDSRAASEVSLRQREALEALQERLLPAAFDHSDPRLNQEVQHVAISMRDALRQIDRIAARFGENVEALNSGINKVRARIEPMRHDLEETERGLGQISSEIGRLTTQIAIFNEMEGDLEDVREEYVRVRARRDALLDDAEKQAETRFMERKAAARSITNQLDEGIEVTIQHLAETSSFLRFLSIALSGGRLQYKALAENISGALLPRQLLQIVENDNVQALSESLSISADRASRVLSVLQEGSTLGELAVTQLEDKADFLLRHGAERKPVDALSTGQKCAITLPVVLTEGSRALILDQPEDHLDNAFLVSRVVKGFLSRGSAGTQTIVATHNPNIPVLGSAPNVVVMGSDGSNGMVKYQAAFDSPEIVGTITDLMEGGRDAFQKRSDFYRKLEKQDHDA